MAANIIKYELPGQHYFKGLLLPGIFPKEECEKALGAKFHKDDILLASYPKTGLCFVMFGCHFSH